MKSELMLLVALAFCAVQAQGPNMVEHSARHRTATPRVTPSPGDALPADSQNCRLVGMVAKPAANAYYGTFFFDVEGDYAYVPCTQDSGIYIFDVSDPTSITVAGRVSPALSGDACCESDGHLYTGSFGIFRVIDVSDPASPTLEGSCVMVGVQAGYTKVGSLIYAATWGSGIAVVDVSDPENPAVLGTCATPGTTGESRQVAVVGDYAYVAAQESGLVVIDASDPADMSIVARLDTGHLWEGIHTLDATHVIAADGLNTWVIDVSTPASPVVVGDYYSGGSGAYNTCLDVDEDYVYCATTGLGMVVLDVSDLTNPTLAGYYKVDPSSDDGASVTRAGRYVYETDFDLGLQVIEFSGDTVGSGVEEVRRPPVCGSRLTATIVRGVMFLTGDGRRETGDRVTLLDAAGRRVMELQPGPNDVRHLSPGVYFVSSPGSVGKVVLTR